MHVVLCAAFPHQADAPDLAGKLSQPAADFNVVFIKQAPPNNGVIHSFR